MWTTQYTATSNASPEALWRLLSDVNGWGAWNDGIETITLDGPLVVGATFRMKPPGEDPVISTIAELLPGRLLTDVTETDDFLIRVAHSLEPTVDGKTLITYQIQVSGQGGTDASQQVGTAVSADFPQVIAKLARTAETAAP